MTELHARMGERSKSMKRINIAVLAAVVAAQIEAVEIDRVFDREVAVREVNYDKSKIGEYTLEDLLESVGTDSVVMNIN